jgi:anti-sigma factor RsiW
MPPILTDEDRANLVAYLDGELDEPARSALEAKLNRDPQARQEAETLRRTWQLLDHLPRPQPSAEFTQTTLTHLKAALPAKSERRATLSWRLWAFGLGWVAALVAASALGHAAGNLWPRRASPTAAPAPVDVGQALAKDLGVVERQHLYKHVEDIRFLKALADPNDADLFGDDDAGL